RQRHEALGRMIGKLRIDRGRDRHHAARADKQRVAVAGLVGDEFGGDAAARRRPVLDQHGLPEQLAEPLADEPCEDIVAAAGCERNDHVDQLVRIVGGGIGLRLEGVRRQHRGERQRGPGQGARNAAPNHVSLLTRAAPRAPVDWSHATKLHQTTSGPRRRIASFQTHSKGCITMSLARLLACASLLSLLSLPAPAGAQSSAPADFKGETVTIQIGYGPGGGYDTYGRALARHYGRFIPGNPSVIPKNMPGAGSLRAANHIYNLTARDAVEIGIFSASTAMEPLMGNDQAKFDVTKFGWIGSMNQDVSFCGVWVGPGIPTTFRA